MVRSFFWNLINRFLVDVWQTKGARTVLISFFGCVLQCALTASTRCLRLADVAITGARCFGPDLLTIGISKIKCFIAKVL